MAERGAIKKRSSSGSNKGQKKRKYEATDTTKCCLISCCGIVNENEDRVEVKTCNMNTTKKKYVVSWSVRGEAVFHRVCWDNVLRNARVRNPKKATILINSEEKLMIKEAAKTAEYHDSEIKLNESAFKIASLIRKANYCVAFTGAGISTSAGIGDYRGKGGKWTEQDRQATASMLDTGQEVDEEDGVPYEQLRPTYTHEALAKLAEMDMVKHIISQNGDGLHGLSGVSEVKLSELHGNVFLEMCEKCGHKYYRPFYVLDDSASQYYEELNEEGVTDLAMPPHGVHCKQCSLNHRTGRKCEQSGCHGYLNDSIINFGDDLGELILTTAKSEASKSDLILSLGTTMQVTPACDLVLMSHEPHRLVIANRQKTGFDYICTQKHNCEELGVRVFGDCDDLMKKVMRYLMIDKERKVWESERYQRMIDFNKKRN